MPPRLSIWGACRSLARPLRSTPRPPPSLQQRASPALARHYGDDATPSAPPPGAPPRWTPSSAMPTIPQSMRRPGGPTDVESDTTPPSSSSSSLSQQPLGEEDVQMRELTQQEAAMQQLQMAAHGLDPFKFTGLKFEEPPMPGAKMEVAQYHMRHRYDDGIAQLTRLLMRDGKLAQAQNNMAMVLTYLRTSPAPKVNPTRPLLPGSPPPEHLPLNPNLYLMLAIDSVAPLIRIRGFTNLAGGGKALEVPTPLNKRARRRIAWMWLMDVVAKKPSTGSGRKMFAQRVGEEIVAIIEGRSGVWDRRNALHKTGTSVRANLNSPALFRSRGRM